MLLACFVYLNLVACSLGSEFKLSDSKLLLPFSTHSQVQYTLSGTDGSCYEWSSSLNEVATVTPVTDAKDKCSRRAIVTSVWQSDHRATATIYAKHSVTGHVVKCDVIVDSIKRIAIETTTQELYLHNTPEALTVFGYDEYGNLFSTLDGIPFEWHIHGGENKADGRSVLRFITWTESEYATPKRIGELEAEGFQGHVQLVSGLRTGSDLVSVVIREQFYSHVPKANVRLLVMANVQLSPPVVYMFPHASLFYHVYLVQSNTQKEVSLESDHYSLQINNTEYAEFAREAESKMVAKKYGQTTVTLIDKNVEHAIMREREGQDLQSVKWQDRRPTSLVYIVEPAYLGLSVSVLDSVDNRGWPPCGLESETGTRSGAGQRVRQWVLEVGRSYMISVDVFDHNSHKMFPSDNQRIQVDFGEQFEVKSSTLNGSHHVVMPIKSGPVDLKASLVGVLDQSNKLIGFEPTITGEQSMLLFDAVKIVPGEALVFPLLPDVIYNLTAISGSGEYVWKLASLEPHQPLSSGDPGMVTLRGEFIPKKFGEAFIVASDARSPRICDFARISVARPSRLEFTPGRAEVLVADPDDLPDTLAKRSSRLDDSDTDGVSIDGIPVNGSQSAADFSVLTIGLAVFDSRGNPFTDCRGMDLEVRSADESKLAVGDGWLRPGSPGGPCIRFRVHGRSPGFTEVIALLRSPELKTALRASFSVGVYGPVRILSPSDGVSSVAVGSSKLVRWRGGPLPWSLEPSVYRAAGVGIVRLSGDPSGDLLGLVAKPRRNANPGQDPSQMDLRVQCNSVGEFEFDVTLGNRLSSRNIKPLLLHTRLKVICDTPASIRLIHHPLSLNLPEGVAPCPSNVSGFSSAATLIPNTIATRVDLLFVGQRGRELDAFDSVKSRVKLATQPSGPVVASLTPHVLQEISEDGRTDYQRYFTIEPSVHGVSTGEVVAEVTTGDLTSYATFNMVPSVHFLTDGAEALVRMFEHPQARGHASLLGGSGQFHIASGDQNNSLPFTMVQKPSPESVPHERLLYEFRALRRGDAKVTVTDRCFPSALSAKEPAVAVLPVSVIGLSALKLTVANQVELNGRLAASVVAIDTQGNVMPHQYAKLLGLTITATPLTSLSAAANQTTTEAKVLHLPPSADRPSTSFWSSETATLDGGGLARFPIIGSRLGISRLTVKTRRQVSGQDWQTVTSNGVDIFVYAPITLGPCNFNLLMGAHFELRMHGGPPHSSVDFSVVENGHLLSLDRDELSDRNAVLVQAARGKRGATAVVEARVMSDGQTTPLTVKCDIHVVGLSGVRIVTPLSSAGTEDSLAASSSSTRHLYVGQAAPVWVEGLVASGDSHAPLRTIDPLGMAGAPLKVHWSLQPNPTNVISLRYWLKGLSVKPSEYDAIAGMQIHGHEAGTASILMRAEYDGGLKEAQAITTISVSPVLGLQLPLRPNPRFLMTPSSSLQLQVFRDLAHYNNIEYRLIETNCQLSDAAAGTGIKIDSKGRLEVGAVTGVSQSKSHSLPTVDGLCAAHIRVFSRPKSAEASQLAQEMRVDVVVKNCRYMLLSPAAHASSAQTRATPGLHVGGPYKMPVQFHDEFGAPFDAVSEAIADAAVKSHRSDIVSVELVSGKFMLRVLSASSAKSAHFTALLGIESHKVRQDNVMMMNTYLTVPRGPGLDLVEMGPLTVGQWSCLPKRPGTGLWSSDNDNIWLDGQSGLFVARKPGSVFVSYARPSTEDEAEPTLMGNVRVEPLSIQTVRLELAEGKATRTAQAVFMSDESLRFRLTLHDQKGGHARRTDCPQPIPAEKLAEQAPFTCRVLEAPISEPRWMRERPAWMAQLLGAVDQTTPAASANLFEVGLAPAATPGQWDCNLRLMQTPTHATMHPSYQLAVEQLGQGPIAAQKVVLLPNLAVVGGNLKLTQSAQDRAQSLAADDQSLRGFDPGQMNMLLHVPPVMQSLLDETKEPLSVRSNSPDKLKVLNRPMRVPNMGDLRNHVKRLAIQLESSSLFNALDGIENAIGRGQESDSAFAQEFYVVHLQAAANGAQKVDIVVRAFGREVVAPVLLDLREVAPTKSSLPRDHIEQQVGWFWWNLLPLLLVLLLSFICFSRIVPLYGSGAIGKPGHYGHSPVSKSMPRPLISSPTEMHNTSRLWSSGFHTSSPTTGSWQRSPVSLCGDVNLRQRSPSRLRSAFDSSL